MNNKMTALVAVLAVSVLALAGVGYAYTALFTSTTEDISSDAIVIDGTIPFTVSTNLDYDSLAYGEGKIAYKPDNGATIGTVDSKGAFALNAAPIAITAKTTNVEDNAVLTVTVAAKTGETLPTGILYYIGYSPDKAVLASTGLTIAKGSGTYTESDVGKYFWDPTLKTLKVCAAAGSDLATATLNLYAVVDGSAIGTEATAGYLVGSTPWTYNDGADFLKFGTEITVTLDITHTDA